MDDFDYKTRVAMLASDGNAKRWNLTEEDRHALRLFFTDHARLQREVARWEDNEIRKATCCNKMEATLELFAASPCTCTLSVAADPIRVKCYGCVAREALGR